MGFFGKAARKVGSWVGKGALYFAAGVSAFFGAVGATPQRNDSVEVVRAASPPDYTIRSGSITVDPSDQSRSGSITYDPGDYFPCWYGCSGSITITAEQLNPQPDIPTASGPAQTFPPGIFGDSQAYKPDRDYDSEDLPADLRMMGDSNYLGIEIVSLTNAELIDYYDRAVPDDRLIVDQPAFRLIALDEIRPADIIYVGAIPSNAIPSNALPGYRFSNFLHFVPLTNGAIPSNETSSNQRIPLAIPSNSIPEVYRRAIPSNYGLIYAIPSNLTRARLLALGADADKLPAAIPSNITRGDLIRYGIPSNAIPSNAIPSNAIPSNAIPSNAIPSNAIPSNLVVLDLGKPLLNMRAIGVEVAMEPAPLLQSPLFMEEALACVGSCRNEATIVADRVAADLGLDISSFAEVDKHTVLDTPLPDENRVLMTLPTGFQASIVPYRSGSETPPDTGVDTVEVGPGFGVETVEIGAMEYLCTEDLSRAYITLDHLYNGDFTMSFTLGPSQNYQAETYELSIDNWPTVNCTIDPENPQLLECIRDEIGSERLVNFVLRSQPGSCEVFNESRYVCPAGETYHDANSNWSGGCCTTSCWCDDAIWGVGCWNDCPGCN